MPRPRAVGVRIREAGVVGIEVMADIEGRRLKEKKDQSVANLKHAGGKVKDALKK